MASQEVQERRGALKRHSGHCSGHSVLFTRCVCFFWGLRRELSALKMVLLAEKGEFLPSLCFQRGEQALLIRFIGCTPSQRQSFLPDLDFVATTSRCGGSSSATGWSSLGISKAACLSTRCCSYGFEHIGQKSLVSHAPSARQRNPRASRWPATCRRSCPALGCGQPSHLRYGHRSK